jgi:DNA-binding CsgD family transcriptional regulator
MTSGQADTRPPEQLTFREKDTLKLLAEGYSNEETANILGLSRRTIESHRARIMHKLKIYDFAGLVKCALILGVTTLQEHSYRLPLKSELEKLDNANLPTKFLSKRRKESITRAVKGRVKNSKSRSK